MNKKLLIPIIAVVVLAVAAVLYFFVFSGEKEMEPAYYVPGDYFVTNVNGSDRNLLKTVVVLVYDANDSKIVEHFDAHQAVMRDSIIFILRDLTAAEIKDQTAVDPLRTKLTDALNQVLGLDTEERPYKIHEVLFSDFVMQ